MGDGRMKRRNDFSYKDFTLGEEYEVDDGVLKILGDTATLVDVSNIFQFKNGTQITTTVKHDSFIDPEEDEEVSS